MPHIKEMTVWKYVLGGTLGGLTAAGLSLGVMIGVVSIMDGNVLFVKYYAPLIFRKMVLSLGIHTYIHTYIHAYIHTHGGHIQTEVVQFSN